MLDNIFTKKKPREIYLLEVVIFNEFSFSSKKFRIIGKIDEFPSKSSFIDLSKSNYIITKKSEKKVCDLNYSVDIQSEKFIQTQYLEDLIINFNFESKDTGCAMNL